MKLRKLFGVLVIGVLAGQLTVAQKSVPRRGKVQKPVAKSVSSSVKVTVIDEKALTAIRDDAAKKGQPLLINFWATWCAPCREEFADLVKIDEQFRDKGLLTVTVSLDDLSELKTAVPQFLAEKKAQMPSYLLKAKDEETALQSVSLKWEGGLPFTVLFDTKGKELYLRQGKFNPEILRTEIEKSLQSVVPKM